MAFLQMYFQALLIVIGFMTIIWILSLVLKNAGIVDVFWGAGFVLLSGYYLFQSGNFDLRSILLMTMTGIWGLRLSVHLFLRNYGKGEDFRYANFRKYYGEKRYWWVSYFQVFLLQGVLMWMISVTLASVFHSSAGFMPGFLDLLGVAVWATGLFFEVVGDWQLGKFRRNPANKGKVLDSGLWRYSRHPNYFGDAAVWWGYALICLAAGGSWQIAGSILMTLLIIKVSGVTLLERTLIEKKQGYREYSRKTSAFIPWVPKNQ